MDMPGPEHVVFIPGAVLVGMVLGWVLGARAAREQFEKMRRRAKE